MSSSDDTSEKLVPKPEARMKRFVQEYVIDRNDTRPYLEAYGRQTADGRDRSIHASSVEACRLLKRPDVLRGIRAAEAHLRNPHRPAPDLPLGEWGRRFLPHYFRFESSLFHADLDRDLSGLHLRRGSRLAYLAPGESAKSTWVTLAYLVRCAVEGWEPYQLILSDTAPQSSKLLRAARDEIESNAELAAAYPEACGAGVRWAETAIQLRNGATVESIGAGNKIRGRRVGQHRPTQIILDDVQSNDDMHSALLRDRLFDWVTREVIPAGSETANYLSVGTALHRECVAVRLTQAPGWTGRSYQAILAWPERMELWRDWERIVTNLAAAPARMRYDGRGPRGAEADREVGRQPESHA